MSKEKELLDILKSLFLSQRDDYSGLYFEQEGDFFVLKIRFGSKCVLFEETYNKIKEWLNG